MDAGDLRPGDLLQLRDGRRLPLRGIRHRPASETVYNFEVADLHTFAVGFAEVLVHNRDTDAPRFEGPKPTYAVNPAHVPGTLRSGKTPLPADAADVFRHAVPDNSVNPKNWYGRSADGRIYRFSGSNDGTVHFSGIDGVGDGIRNITPYARRRLEEQLP